MLFKSLTSGLVLAAVVAAATLTPALTAQAQEPATAEQRALCTPDVFRLCASEIPNVSAIITCMKVKRPLLSKGCAAVFPK